MEILSWQKIKELQNDGELEIPVVDDDYLAVLILNSDLCTLVVEENHHKDKPWSVVTETCQSSDKTIAYSLKRAINEEVSADNSSFAYIPGSYASYDLENGSKLHAVAVFCNDYKNVNLQPLDSTEIVGYQWADAAQLDALSANGKLEPEVIGFYHWMMQNLGSDGLNC